MRIRKTLIAILALAIAIAFSPLPELQAAVLNPGSQPQSDSVIETVKAKKSMKKYKKKRKGKRGKRAKSKGKCKGTYMYWKKGKCHDARNKK
jgi:hypothetical protein